MMNFKQKLIQRHKNPLGLILRILTYSGISIALWHHEIFAIIILLVIDLLNWFFMPMVKVEKELPSIQKIVDIEIHWIKSPWGLWKTISLIISIFLFVVTVFGLWTHNWTLFIISFILIAILKQLILKLTAKK